MQITWGNLSKYRREIMGFACLWIMFFHNLFDWPTVTRPIQLIASYGNSGVELFLLMSGIGLYYGYRPESKLGDFYLKRFVRLFIPYIIFVVPFWAWWDLCLGKGNFILDVTMLSFPLRRRVTTWYIAAIAVCYLLFPVIYYLQNSQIAIRGRLIQRHTVTICICMAVFVLCLVMQKLIPALYDNIEIALTRGIIFTIGCDLGKSVKEQKPISQSCVWAAAFSIAINVIFQEMVPLPTFWFRMFYIPLSLGVCVVLAAVLPRIRVKWILKALGFVGDRSLELYLSHVLLINVYLQCVPQDLFDPWGVIGYTFVLLAAFVISTLLHPLIGWLSRFALRHA